jgi:hypothetical protein
MNVEIETEAAQFPEKEYMNGIFVAMQLKITDELTCYIQETETVFTIPNKKPDPLQLRPRRGDQS